MTPELKAQLEGCKALPTPPGVATQIVQLANDPEADMNRISQVLAMDPAITTKILRIANSPDVRAAAQDRKPPTRHCRVGIECHIVVGIVILAVERLAKQIPMEQGSIMRCSGVASCCRRQLRGCLLRHWAFVKPKSYFSLR